MIDLRHGDCLEVMKNIPDNSIDMVLTDPPYGTTQCKWDSVIPFEPMWEQLKRITKDNGAICLFGSEPFSSALRMSNIKMFKYDWIWKKNYVTGQLLAKRQPLRDHEKVHVFYKKQCLYNRQMIRKTAEEFKKSYRKNATIQGRSSHFSNEKSVRVRASTERQWEKPPVQILKFVCERPRKGKNHPTQKPVPLLEYLIKTYTLEGETVLDFTMGSGSTGVACKNLNRDFIGIEKDDKYFQIAKDRVNA